jgi:hypothetical protein
MGERTEAAWQKFLPLKANISYALEAWWEVGRRLDETRKTWTEQTEQTVREWQHKAARVVELIFPPKGDTEPRESDVSNPFPLEVLPPVIKYLAVSFSETWETPLETVALCMLTVASASLGKWVFAISDKGKPIRGNIFTYISLSASGNKSIAFDEAMDPVIRHNEARREYHQEVELDDLNAEIEELELEIKKLKKQAETDDGLNKGALAELYRKKRKAEAKLKFWSIQSSDFTIQALIQKGIRTRSVFIASDEAKIVKNIILGQYDDGYSNEPFLCKLYSSSSHERERVGDGESSAVSGICGSTLLLGQPHISRSLFEDQTMKESGFVPRFLFAAVPSELKEERPNSPPIQGRNAYYSLVVNLLQRYWKKWEQVGEIDPVTEQPITEEELMVMLQFSSEAFDVLREFKNSIIRSKYAKRLDTLDSVILRLKENAMRVAIVLHVIKNVPSEVSSEISRETALEAIAIVRWCFRQYLEFSYSAHEEQLNKIEMDVLAFTKKKGTVNARSVSRGFRADFASTDKAQALLERLVAKAKLVEVQEESATTGRPKSPSYSIA